MMQQELKESGKTRLYKRRWAFLVVLVLLQFVIGWAFSCFGQISNFYVKFFSVHYSLVNWLTMADTLAPVITTLPLAWLTFKGSLGFRNLSISGAVFSVLGFMCIAISTSCRSCFGVAFLGQIFNSLAVQLTLTTPPIFAVLWFPEKEVGTAISINVLGIYLGGTLGLIIPSTSLHLDFSNSTSTEEELMEDNHILMIIYVLFTALSLAISIFLMLFVTDRPPTPPTEAQRLKMDPSASQNVPRTFWAQTKSIFTNGTAVLIIIAMGIIWQIYVVEITTMSRIIEGFVSNHDAMGAYVMAIFYVGSVVGTVACGKVVDVYKRYKVLSLVVTGIAFASTVAIVVSVQYKCYVALCISNLVYGAASQAFLVVGFEIVTQQTFPLDENFVSFFVVGFILPTAALFGEIGEVIYKVWGGVAILIFQSAAILVAIIICCFLNVTNKRLAVVKPLPGADVEMPATTPLLNKNRTPTD